MALGRGSAMVLLVCFLIFHSEMTHADTYIVGDGRGWTFHTVGWPLGMHFSAGDTLVFNYIPGTHNVVVVDKAGYDTCKTPPGARVYRSGHDQIKLARGDNYFICNFVGHCENGMEIAVHAT